VFEFEILATDGQARAGVFHTPHGPILTPVFMPVGTAATVKAVSPRDLQEIGVNLVLANTYHLHLRPGDELIRDMGGLHQFMAWPGPMLTDSGGFQVFSLATINRIDDEGVTFRNHIDGSSIQLTPERSIHIQQNLGADIIMCLDECTTSTERKTVEQAVRRTNAWATRCQETHPQDNNQALFGIAQGGIFPDLRAQSARFLQTLNFSGYAIGGLAVGETKSQMYDILTQTVPLLPPEKPHYLMGVGEPDDLAQAICRGVDMFDCVMPTRVARHGAALTPDGRINLHNLKYARDDAPLQADCDCYCCRTFSRAYLRHLVKARELLAHYLLTIHNIRFLIHYVQTMRNAILQGKLAPFVDIFLTRYLQSA